MGKVRADLAAVAWDVYMTWTPTKDDRFPIVGEMCIVFDYFLYDNLIIANRVCTSLSTLDDVTAEEISRIVYNAPAKHCSIDPAQT